MIITTDWLPLIKAAPIAGCTRSHLKYLCLKGKIQAEMFEGRWFVQEAVAREWKAAAPARQAGTRWEKLRA